MDKKTNCWGFRINWRNEEALKVLNAEMKEGRLRQGWGWCEEQKLPNPTLDKGEKGNLPIYRNVKKGDYLLIPHCPSLEEVTIVRAAQDFATGYQFNILPKFGDYGHVFPIEKHPQIDFLRIGNVVGSDIRFSLRTPMRFWNMTGCLESVLNIINADPIQRHTPSRYEQRTEELLNEAFEISLQDDSLKVVLKELFERNFQTTEWEFALRKILELLVPHCVVKRVGGKNEVQHGCDLAVFIPSFDLNQKYVIGIQIKDFKGNIYPETVDGIINQISNADNYWNKNKGFTLIDKYLIVIDASIVNNKLLDEKARNSNIRVLYKEDVLNLLARAVKIQMANNVLNIAL